MKKKFLVLLAIVALCMLTILSATAANTFVFTEKVITIFEGETASTALTRDGTFAEDGEIAYTTNNAKAATVDSDGTVTGVAKGKAVITAALTQNGKVVKKATVEIRVARRVTKVTLSQKNLTLLMSDDPTLAGVLTPADPDQPPVPVIVIAARRGVALNAVCTPEDATDRKVSFSTTDVGVAKINGGNQLYGVEQGECDLTVSSVQNPEITETFHVLVIDPLKKIQIEAPSKTVFAGESMSLDLVYQPETATIQKVVWSSNKPAVATVDENGMVTGVAKGQAKIEAKALDGSGVAGSIIITVMQNVEEITLKETDITVAVNKTQKAVATLLPANADNKKVTWTSSDEGIAVVRTDGSITGKQPGTCVVTVTSVSNPSVSASMNVTVVQPVTKIVVSSPAKTIFVGERTEMDAMCQPENATNQNVTWNSRRPAVATVDESGVVTGVARGQAVIEAKATDGSNVTGTYTITVAQDVNEVTLKETSITVAVPKSHRVAATVLPKDADNKKLTWTSSDEGIASVKTDGTIVAKKAGACVITATSVSNPSVTASVNVTVTQPVTKVSFTTPAGLSFPVQTSQQLAWTVEPYDATVKDVTFKSHQPKIATVDAYGVVTGVSKGTATITATAADGSNRSANYKVEIIQPVEGVTLPQSIYYVQRDRARSTGIRANVLPKNANNQNVYWEIGDDYVASVRSTGGSNGRITGLESGTTMVTAITEDGGFVATATVQVSDYDGAVYVESLQITEDNRILIGLLNLSSFTVDTVYLRVDCYDTQNYPMIYNVDGVSTGFDASYPLPLQPGERSIHGQFNFGQYLDTGTLGAVIVTVTGYKFNNGQTWEIPEEYRRPSQPYYSSHMWEPTPTALPPTNEASTGGTND